MEMLRADAIKSRGTFDEMKPELCLGTVQFGLPYGITNAVGLVSEAEVTQILDHATASNIRWLDTAQSYGNAEAVLGRNLPADHSFRVISKLPAQRQAAFTVQDVESWEQGFSSSCEQLGLKSLDGLLLHAPTDLMKPGSTYLENWLLELRTRGLVQRIGVSIYTASDLDGVNPELLDLVQLPLSLFDQRLLQDQTVARLRANGTAIHARSIYLQGLLLIPAEHWPRWVSEEVRRHQQALEAQSLHRGCRLIDLALGFAKAQTDLEAVVVGICNKRELVELQKSWEAESPWQEGEWEHWALQDANSIDPRRWPH
jgi:aryl-alcohol dehydrogenase-like predicted oxidoreductase